MENNRLSKIKKWGIIGGSIGVLLLIGQWVWPHVNIIPQMDEDVNAKWSQVLNNYQRRSDLVPNLVATVKGYASHEQETLEAVTNARSEAFQTTVPEDILTNEAAFQTFQAKQDNLGSMLGRLLLLQEQYPNLKADQTFLNLQSQLEGTENRIAIARKDYIESVQAYNTEVRTYPGKLVAALMYDSTPKQNFTTAQENQEAPQVQF